MTLRLLAFALILGTSALARATGFSDAAEQPPVRETTTVELHGALRLRGDALGNLDLDRGVTPSGRPLYPVPLAEATGQWLTAGDLRLRTDLSLLAPGGTLAVRVRADLFDNVLLGSTPEGAPVASTTQRASGAIRLRRAYGEAFTPVGLLAAGRMGNTWGLGMLANGGDCADCDSGDAADRIAFITPLAGHLWALAYDLTSTGPHTRRVDNARTLDIDPTDDVRTVTFAFMRWHTDAARARRMGAGKTTVDYGAYGSYRWQKNDVPSDYIPVANPQPLDPAQVMARDYQAAAVSGWLRVTHPLFRVELEAAGLFARVGQPSLLPGVLLRTPVTSTQFGLALESEFGPQDARWRLGFDGGLASGDPAPGFGANPGLVAANPKPGDLDGPQANPPLDTRVDNFRFHPDYRIDRILFREIIGTVTDAAYLRPHARYRVLKLGPGQLSASVAAIASFAMEPTSTPGGERPLGIEIDPSLFWAHADGFALWLDYAVLFPLSGLDNPATHQTAKPAQLARVRLAFAF